MSKKRELNLRDLGDISALQAPKGGKGGVIGQAKRQEQLPKGLFLRSGKLSILTPEECSRLCNLYNVKCVIDLRTPVETAEYPDPLPEGIDYLQIPLLKDASVGITHETGSDPMAIIKRLRKSPEKLKEMIPDFKALYAEIVTDEYSRRQLDKAVETLRENAGKGICTLFHCTAGKDRTGVVSMALLKSYGIDDEYIIKDYMLTNRNAFWPTMKKCLGIWLMTWNWRLVRTAYQSFMAQRRLIETAMEQYG